MAATMESLRHPVVLNNLPFVIEEERILRELRIPKVSSLKEMPEHNIAGYIKKAIDAAYTLIEAKGIYRTFSLKKISGGPPGVEDAPGLFFGKRIVELLQPCDYVSLLLVTIGPALPVKADDMVKKEPTDAYYLESVGGWMADYLADRVEAMIAAESRKNGYSLTMRYSPGYGDWTLEAQPAMLRLLESHRIGVSLTDSRIMIPRKSVSAAIGWLPKSLGNADRGG